MQTLFNRTAMVPTLCLAVLLSGCGAPGDGAAGSAMAATTTAAAAPTSASAASPSVDANRPDADHPVVVELFQSQGCSSCPPANANLNQLAARPDILALSFAVTYWDRLGWPDRFATPAFTQRQRHYADRGGRDQVWTPQIIVNGAGTVVGTRRAELDALIARAGRPRGGPQISVEGGMVRLSAASGATPSPATIWLVRYDPRVQQVAISAGENAGRTLPHRNIVRRLDLLGQWTGAAMALPVQTSPDPAWRSAILIQRGQGGPIIAARRL